MILNTVRSYCTHIIHTVTLLNYFYKITVLLFKFLHKSNPNNLIIIINLMDSFGKGHFSKIGDFHFWSRSGVKVTCPIEGSICLWMFLTKFEIRLWLHHCWHKCHGRLHSSLRLSSDIHFVQGSCSKSVWWTAVTYWVHCLCEHHTHFVLLHRHRVYLSTRWHFSSYIYRYFFWNFSSILLGWLTRVLKKKSAWWNKINPVCSSEKKAKRIRNPGLSVKYEHLWKTYLFIYLFKSCALQQQKKTRYGSGPWVSDGFAEEFHSLSQITRHPLPHRGAGYRTCL